MNIPERWLRSYCDPALDADALAHALTMGGIEVESCVPVAALSEGVIVAQVLGVEKHPQADKLSVCKVDAGKGPVQVVCGAPNVRPGMKAPLATPGARLPGIQVGVAKVRGVESAGMLLSARELGISDDHSGLFELAPDAPIGKEMRELLDLDERILSIKLTPNRGDCLSVVGVARELSAITRTKLNSPEFPRVEPAIDDVLPVRIDAPDLPSEREFVASISRTSASGKSPTLELTPEQRAALPVPAKPAAPTPEPEASGPVRDYPPLEPN